MGSPKPDDVSDRTWQSLKKELESPATIKKQESCTRANASRVNFGRTVPSGEVGMHERLQKLFYRSPDPKEISFEMARNKGYGGRSKRKEPSENVMHERQVASVTLEDGQIGSRSGHDEGESRSRENSPPASCHAPVDTTVKENPYVDTTTDKVTASRVLSISEEQIA